jgi:hypothetical protein
MTYPSNVGEVWKTVGSKPWIEASSFGRVRASYDIAMPRGGVRRRTVSATPGYSVSPVRNSDYRRCIIRIHGKTLKVHRLVCEAFHGPAPKGRTLVLHKNEDGTDNRPANLFWGTQEENLNAPGFIRYCQNRKAA